MFRLVADCWLLVAGGWLLVAGGCLIVAGRWELVATATAEKTAIKPARIKRAGPFGPAVHPTSGCIGS
ncbi:MAG: hypothetical protein DMG01_13120 [Acidobacteria bacterium]|nr:MAG: hypothetical protein DMG01_13120 [Acidobacteriota bacterium]